MMQSVGGGGAPRLDGAFDRRPIRRRVGSAGFPAWCAAARVGLGVLAALIWLAPGASAQMDTGAGMLCSTGVGHGIAKVRHGNPAPGQVGT